MNIGIIGLIIAGVVILITVVYFIANKILKKLSTKFSSEVEEKKAAYVAIRNLMRSEMIGLVKDCMTKGYTEEEDRQIFADLLEVYQQLKGNHDIEEKRKVFYALPYYEHARRESPHLIYEQLERQGTWIYDNSIPDSDLKPDIANIRRIKTGKDIVKQEKQEKQE